MKIHPTFVEGFDVTIEELAGLVGKMRYDQLLFFLKALKNEIARQIDGDWKRGRVKLAMLLLRVKIKLNSLIKIVGQIVDGPCKKYIKIEKEIEDDNHVN